MNSCHLRPLWLNMSQRGIKGRAENEIQNDAWRFQWYRAKDWCSASSKANSYFFQFSIACRDLIRRSGSVLARLGSTVKLSCFGNN